MNGCSGCGQDFSSVALFDMHRVGKHEYSYSEGCSMVPLREDGRRCLSTDEMTSKGWTLNSRNRWVDPALVEASRERLAALVA